MIQNIETDFLEIGNWKFIFFAFWVVSL